MAGQLKQLSSAVEMDVQSLVRLAAAATDVPFAEFSVYYDREADVVYVSGEPRQAVTNSEMRADGVLLNYNDSQVVGITVLSASKR